MAQASLPAPAGSVLVSGENTVGQRGNGGTNQDSSMITQVPGPGPIVQIEANLSNTVYAIAADGSLWSWGDNSRGQTGDPTNSELSPVRVPIPGRVTDLDSTTSITFALTDDGSVWAWGQGYEPTPAVVPGLPAISQIAMETLGGVFALATDGSVWTWWDGVYGMTRPTPAQPHQVAGLSDIKELAVEYYAAFALDHDGKVWGWGSNDNGYVGTDTTEPIVVPTVVPDLPPIVSITGSTISLLALDETGRLWCWGFNLFGMCGTGATPSGPADEGATYLEPVQVPKLPAVDRFMAQTQQAIAFSADGIYVWGNGMFMNYVDDSAFVKGFSGVPSPALLHGLDGAAYISDGGGNLLIIAG